MIHFFSIAYGLHITILIYLFSYFTAKGILGAGSASSLIVAAKFIIYWKVIAFGFKYLPASGILIGLTGSIYLSLPLLYWVNRRITQ